MKVLVLLACVALAAAGRPELDEDWQKFKDTYQKEYADQDEEDMRRTIWEDNHDFMEGHNAAFEAGDETFEVGENEFNDMTHGEFIDSMNGMHNDQNRRAGRLFTYDKSMDMPSTVNWTAKGYVTGVKNQKQCGSCWAFSATGSLEGQHFKKTGKLVSLSEQNLVDCSRPEGNHGCGGGFMDWAFEYIIKNGGIDTEASYPYTAKDGTCHFNKTNVGATMSGYTDIKKDDEDALKAAVASVGPVSVGIDAGHRSFQMYKRGVYFNPTCSSIFLDHGVLAVGYGTDTANGMSSDYWLVKNSWGGSWGDFGYIKMARNKNNNCGIATSASFPLV